MEAETHKFKVQNRWASVKLTPLPIFLLLFFIYFLSQQQKYISNLTENKNKDTVQQYHFHYFA